MVTAEQVRSIGTTPGTDPGSKRDPQTSQTQAIVNLTNVMQLIALILIEIRDGKKDVQR